VRGGERTKLPDIYLRKGPFFVRGGKKRLSVGGRRGGAGYDYQQKLGCFPEGRAALGGGGESWVMPEEKEVLGKKTKKAWSPVQGLFCIIWGGKGARCEERMSG